MHHILGHIAARWAQNNSTTTPEAFIARCDDPKVLLSAIEALAASGALSAGDLQRAREAGGLLYSREFPDIRTSDDAAVARLEKMLAEARDRYVKHVTAERCNLLRAALPNLESAVASAQSVGAVMARARKIANVLFGECEFSVHAVTDGSLVTTMSVALTYANKGTKEFYGTTEPAAWKECVAWLSEQATEAARRARFEADALASKADRLALAVQAPTDPR
jgi:hypothetical protein